MKIVINFTCVFLTALILTGCATGGGFRMVQRSDQDVTRLMAINDNTIVPGDRIGQVFLGMTEDQLYQRLGEPSKTQTASGTVDYVYPSLNVNVDAITHKVWEIDMQNPAYSTVEGISIGSSGLALRTKIREQYTQRSLASFTNNDYPSGLTVTLNSIGDVAGLSVWIPGEFHY